MTWKSRNKKSFLRLIKSLEETEIFLVGPYIVINECVAATRDWSKGKYQLDVQSQYEEYLSSGKIKSFLEFDSYFNPDLNFIINFEPDEKKADLIAKEFLHQIGNRWAERLRDLFPEHEYTLVMCLDSADSEWFLDFYNGNYKIDSERMRSEEHTSELQSH